jgi:hypothetical protein
MAMSAATRNGVEAAMKKLLETIEKGRGGKQSQEAGITVEEGWEP